jgi:hypothetical protein
LFCEACYSKFDKKKKCMVCQVEQEPVRVTSLSGLFEPLAQLINILSSPSAPLAEDSKSVVLDAAPMGCSLLAGRSTFYEMFVDAIVHDFMWRVSRVQPPEDVKWPLIVDLPWNGDWGGPWRVIDRVKRHLRVIGIRSIYRPDRACLSLELSASIISRARVFAGSAFLSDVQAASKVDDGKCVRVTMTRKMLANWIRDLGARMHAIYTAPETTASAKTILYKLYDRLSNVLDQALDETVPDSIHAIATTFAAIRAQVGIARLAA